VVSPYVAGTYLQVTLCSRHLPEICQYVNLIVWKRFPRHRH